jgi:hypothetical protein
MAAARNAIEQATASDRYRFTGFSLGAGSAADVHEPFSGIDEDQRLLIPALSDGPGTPVSVYDA